MQEECSRQKQEYHALQAFQGGSEIGFMQAMLRGLNLALWGATEVF